ncbi:Isopenicillin N epimerase component 2 [Talaromyces islandicus]|uniref:Isopenicillin N epimerase component 2 n=1 Tax=Talaromyces islandicus TaxID=28573 RepID=A0A0U1LKM6_TALIS|nr:Isopenicillin N epimerase component 2 [Talaromyces islandicus]
MTTNTATQRPPLAGVKVLELAGTVITPFTGMLLADLGCDVVRVDAPAQSKKSPWVDSLCRRKKSVVIDFKSPPSRQAFFDLLQAADVLIDPHRAGVFDRLSGMSADELCRRYPRLIYARVTGFARDDKIYGQAVGHESNYMAVSGGLPALHHVHGKAGILFKPTTNYVANFGGGGMASVVGILAAIVHRAASGKGQIVDASVQQGTAYMATIQLQRRNGQPKGEPSLDINDSPYSDVYRTLDGKYMMVVCVEDAYYERMIRLLGLEPGTIPSREDRGNWPVLKKLIGQRFGSKTQRHWRDVFDGAQACVTPVLDADDMDSSPPLVQLSETPSLPLPDETGRIPQLEPGEGSEEICQSWLGPRSTFDPAGLVIDGSSRILSRRSSTAGLVAEEPFYRMRRKCSPGHRTAKQRTAAISFPGNSHQDCVVSLCSNFKGPSAGLEDTASCLHFVDGTDEGFESRLERSGRTANWLEGEEEDGPEQLHASEIVPALWFWRLGRRQAAVGWGVSSESGDGDGDGDGDGGGDDAYQESPSEACACSLSPEIDPSMREQSWLVTLEVDSGELYDASSFLSSTETDSGYGAPSLQSFSYENGRRYHAFRQGSYMMPNDEKEQERLDLAHHIFKLVLRGRLGRSVFTTSPGHVLDFGTGTGSWAIDFADENPDSRVVGIDLSLIQPGCAPPNCRFFVDDVESAWTYDAKFDYVHGRSMSGSIKDWDTLLEQAYANLNEGGVIELQEYETVYKSDDDTLTRTPAIVKWQQKLNEASEKINQPLNLAQTMKRRLEDAGFVDVRDDAYKVPVGPWPKDRRLKEIGYMMLFHCLEGLDAFTLAPFSRVLGWTKEEMQELIEDVKSEFVIASNHLYVIIHFVHGRKPTAQ